MHRVYREDNQQEWERGRQVEGDRGRAVGEGVDSGK